MKEFVKDFATRTWTNVSRTWSYCQGLGYKDEDLDLDQRVEDLELLSRT